MLVQKRSDNLKARRGFASVRLSFVEKSFCDRLLTQVALPRCVIEVEKGSLELRVTRGSSSTLPISPTGAVSLAGDEGMATEESSAVGATTGTAPTKETATVVAKRMKDKTLTITDSECVKKVRCLEWNGRSKL